MSAVRAVPEKRRPEQSAAGPTPAGFVLGLDVGSSVIRCHVYDHATLIRGSSAQKVESLYPQAGWVEIDPDALWLQFVTVIKESVRVAGIEMNQIVGLGISTQRATFITWNKKTGNHFHNFISWQDLRAVELVKSWNNSLIMKLLQNSCRVLHFFTRNKRFLAVSLFNFTNQHVSLRLAWILQNLVEVQKAVEEDNCCFGTLDTWLLHKLTKGSEFATDFSNASATGLFDPYKMHWSGLLASLLSIPLSILPPVKDTSHNFGSVDEEIFGVPIPIVAMIWSQAATRSKVNFQQHLGTTRNMGMVPHELFEFMCFSLFLRAVAETARWLCPELAVLPGAQLSWQKSLPRAKFLAFQTTIPLELLENSSKIPQELAVVADQQSAMFGECCFHAGDVKLTMGTGTFLDINTGNNLQHTIGGFYPLIGWKIGQEVVCLAESNAGDTGTIIKWAQELDLFTDAAETEKMAKSLEDSEGVCFVPSFSGLQAPLNDPCACASFMGLKPSTNKYHLVRAILESIAFRNKQLYELMQKEIHIPVTKVRADGGVCKNNFVMQMTSDLINANIERPVNIDMSCLGAASLAGLAIGFWTDKEELKKLRQSEVVFEPQKKWQEYEMSMENWVKAVKRSMNWYNKM